MSSSTGGVASAFSYQGLATGITGELKRAATRVRELVGEQHASVAETGRIFLDIKAKLDHGQFLAWVEAECGMSARSVQNYMAVAEMALKYETVSHFEPSSLYLLAALSTPGDVRQKIFARAAKGETIRLSEIKSSIRTAREKDRSALTGALGPAPKTPRIPAAQARALAISGFATTLHLRLADTLDDLTRLLGDEKVRIADAVPLQKRIVLARGYLAALGVGMADLKPIAD